MREVPLQGHGLSEGTRVATGGGGGGATARTLLHDRA